MKNINKLIAMILVVAIAALTTTACEVKPTPMDLTNDEVESKILDLESQVADLESQLGNIESAVNIPDGTVKTSYEELLAVCKDIFEQTVETDLECIEDPDFGVPSDIDKIGFISATWRTNDSDTEPSYFVTIWYDAGDVWNKTANNIFKDWSVGGSGTETHLKVYWKTSDDEFALDVIIPYMSSFE